MYAAFATASPNNAADLSPSVVGKPQACPASLQVLFIGRSGVPGWTRLLADVRHLLAAADIEVSSIAGLERLEAASMTSTDIVFLQCSTPRGAATAMKRIHDLCPFVSPVLVSTRRESGPGLRPGPPEISIAGARVVSEFEIHSSIIAAMRLRVGWLKMVKGHGEEDQLARHVSHKRIFHLTPQEGRVLLGVQQGLPNKVIAWRLNVTLSTVKSHMTRIFKKTGFTQRAELIAHFAELVLDLDGNSMAGARLQDANRYTTSRSELCRNITKQIRSRATYGQHDLLTTDKWVRLSPQRAFSYPNQN
jgi:DNA-binding CsgD family transcriptional regulator